MSNLFFFCFSYTSTLYLIDMGVIRPKKRRHILKLDLSLNTTMSALSIFISRNTLLHKYLTNLRISLQRPIGIMRGRTHKAKTRSWYPHDTCMYMPEYLINELKFTIRWFKKKISISWFIKLLGNKQALSMTFTNGFFFSACKIFTTV